METVKIGNLEWSNRNLDIVVDGSWDYDNDPANREKYGRLYTWDAAMKAVAMLGDGWRFPTCEEWDDLIKVAGGKDIAGERLKAKSPHWDGSDVFGFSALPGGHRRYDGNFNYVDSGGGWWTATEGGSDGAYGRGMDSDNAIVWEFWLYKSYGFSVRCVRDIKETVAN